MSDAPAKESGPANAHPASPPQQVVMPQRPSRSFGRLRRLLTVGLAVAVALLVVGQLAGFLRRLNPPTGLLETYHSLDKNAGQKIAIITVEGAILNPEGFIKQQVDRVREDPQVVAVVLRIDSPGGTVTASDYLYHHLRKLVEDRRLPLVVSMGGLCASGGYYLAMAAGEVDDVVFAEPTTWTGSIGVLIPHYDLSGLLARWDVRDDSVASHPNKLMGSPTRELLPDQRAEERKLLQDLVDRSFERFKHVVLSGRPKLKDQNEKLAEATTGKVFTAEQALELGLVDKIGFIEEAVHRAAQLAKRDRSSLRCVRYETPPSALEWFLGVESPLTPASRTDLASLLELAAPRAYYLYTGLPALLVSRP